jgi:hypothetical protein
MFDVLKAQKRRPAMKKISTMQAFSNEILKEQKLTIGVDLGDRWSFYCVLDEAGKIILEQKVATTPEAMKQTFAKIPRSLIALETGTHSPWVSRLSRNSPLCGRRLDNLVSQLGGFPLEIFDLYVPMLSLVDGGSLVHIFHPVAEHAVDQASQLRRHGLDRAGGT